ncbi:MAG: CRISPR-associated endoribonuclease Cas6 [Candidatus Heimdallarchaeaceae archaeon]
MVSVNSSEELVSIDASVVSLPGGEISLSLLSQSDAIIPYYSGSLVRGAFLNLISSINPVIADKLHSGNNIRPYAVESIKKVSCNHKRTNRNELIINKGEQIKLSLKILDSNILNLLIQHLINTTIPRITIINQEFVLSDLSYSTKRVEITNGGQKLKINFLTPTYFSMLNRSDSMFFPDPKYLFMNLAKLWNTFNSEIFIPEKPFFKWLDKNVKINDYATSTKRVYIGKRTPIKGFQGWVVYRFPEDKVFLPWIHLLSKFGELSNVGGSRTAGFGVIRSRWIKEKEEEEAN